MSRVLVTGATGFIGSRLSEALARAGYLVRGALRTDRFVPASIAEKVVVGDINSTTDWTQALQGVDWVIHTAARVHVLPDARAAENLYRETNDEGTERLATDAARAKVNRLIYLSSIKVNGEETSGRAYTELDEPSPQDAYALSKWEAEKHVLEIAERTGMEAAIVRPPLVYGPGVRANFLRLLQWVDRGWPLPLGAVRNRRSLVSVWNLCDFLLHVMTHARAPGRSWMVSDGEDLSTPDLIRRIAAAMGRRARLISVPVGLLRLSAGLVRRRGELARLTDSLAVDIADTRTHLKWSPGTSVDEALCRTVAWYLSEGRSR
jgi:UDP-N-acetyl-alpha-D-quinovosamine dehydrogenase